MIEFNANKHDTKLIGQIAKRAHALWPDRTVQDYAMDIEAVHCNGCPLDLDKMLKADDFNFAHDVVGIERYLDRDDNSPTAGQLHDFFLPRCAA